ncbi:MAG: DUF3592 domain-containing protein [Candidatus Thiodiazotropha sp. (ex Ctena orbiculata)]|uniref:DUF3592 domain-containing protein n=1 Tax=Candidatus Thiodiazotropha taylori TaxID=2792791 RepID=A0A944QUK4_9GAMM|nr:DUF3592 domain-containing protein [Candidatus Thiodiazotropha taylori]MBT2997838.1 DUF3592 domain-containing protein [Candidatus Thiodiazotropha taylori]MBT3000393.1 DUF3592 domain-containing protein [Candidatus Thiodiazotropha taylori]MBT3027397.1 DUF3592 domain-containing protein [Candidatus Thiodiazotropha taylori]MBV2107238.1 DUF3592 domain-containing protein [Candidatus Thiodiazotropha taylori]
MAPEYAHYILLLVAAILIVVGAGSLLNYRSQSSWLESKATLVSIEEHEEAVAISQYSRLKYYYPTIEYEYTANGKFYSGNRVSVEKENVWIPEVNAWGDPTPVEERWWLSLKPGDDLPVYINPRNHDQAVLIKGASKARSSHHLALLLGGMLVGLIWLTVVSFKFT